MELIHFNDSVLTLVLTCQLGGMVWVGKTLFTINARLAKLETIIEIYSNRRTERLT